MSATTRRISYEWKLRRLMADHDMFNTTDLIPHLVERGVELSSVQVYRLVTQRPERLNLTVLAALCDIFGCTPADLIDTHGETVSTRHRDVAAATGSAGEDRGRGRRPTRARIVDDQA